MNVQNENKTDSHDTQIVNDQIKLLFDKLCSRRKADAQVLMHFEYRGIWETAIKKYSESAHFIYELLQNADDAKASWVKFELEPEGLLFKHNGDVRFTVSDCENVEEDTKSGLLGHVNSITSIGNSSKVDEQKIGKFGIGFKAVFAYTLTPHIHDDIFHFKLVNYIVPEEVPAVEKRRNSGETLFYFPFNHPAKPANEAFAEISEKLQTLVQPVLFLSNLSSIYWEVQMQKGHYGKELLKQEQFSSIEASHLVLKQQNDNEEIKQPLILFSKSIKGRTTGAVHRISVGYFLDAKGKLKTDLKYPAFCFFPTKEDTKLGFVIQAPFLLTDSREGIKKDEPWNQELISHLAELSADTLLLLKSIGINENRRLLDDSILEVIPYEKEYTFGSNISTRISFSVFYDCVRSQMESEELLPGRNGRYFHKSKAYWAVDPELVELFSDEQISFLMKNEDAGFVFISKGQKQLSQANKSLGMFISSLTTETLDAKKLLRRFDTNFIELQDDDWIIKLYSYLDARKHLWDDDERLAQKRPILLNQNRKAIVPFDEKGLVANIFLPADRLTSFDTVYKPFVEHTAALRFIKNLGIDYPDLKSEIYGVIIKQYQRSELEIGHDKHLEYFDTFLSYFNKCNVSERQVFISELKTLPILATCNNRDQLLRFAPPVKTYYLSEELEVYFGSVESHNFLNEEFYIQTIEKFGRDNFYEFLSALTVSDIPRIVSLQQPNHWQTLSTYGLLHIEQSPTYYSWTLRDKTLEGLSNAIANISLEGSVILFRFLLRYASGKDQAKLKETFFGTFRHVPKFKKHDITILIPSQLYITLTHSKWLYDIESNPCTPDSLIRDSLHVAYEIDESADGLLYFLGVKQDEVTASLSDEQKKAYQIGKRLQEAGFTEEELEQMLSLKTAIGNNESKEVSEENNAADIEQEIAVEKTLRRLKEGIRNRSQMHPKEKRHESMQQLSQTENEWDQDDYSPPSIQLQKKIDRLRDEAERNIESLSRIEALNDVAVKAEKYSYGWFKALLELECLNSSEGNSIGKQFSIEFGQIIKEAGTARTLVLQHPSRYIPQTIEDIGDLQIRLYADGEPKTITVEVVQVKEYTLHAKLKRAADIEGINLTKIDRVVLEVKNPVFILEELRRAFSKLVLEDSFNMQQNLTEQIRFIFGPPGTGKTRHLAEKEIIPLMQKSETIKVLVLTPTNKAADVLTNRIIERMQGDESYYHWLLRFGSTGDQSLEGTSLVVDKSFDIESKPRNTTITTIARFAYDYFQPEIGDDRHYLKDLPWDYIIIDESSMINLPSIAYVLYQQKNAQFIIAGDPFQIQPISQITQWKDLNIYDMVNLKSFTNHTTVPHSYEVLPLMKQYRAIPAIGELFSRFAYDGKLDHDRSNADQKKLIIGAFDFKDINIIKFPVTKYESIYKPGTLNGSHYQAYVALFTIEFVSFIAREISKKQSEKFRIGVICPYKAQASMIERTLAHQHVDNNYVEVLVGTIHGFQGDECDIIVSVFNPPYSITNSPNRFLNKQHILNVSISRARDYLFILMPNDATQNVEALFRLKKIEQIAKQHAGDRISEYRSEWIEKEMLGSETHIYDNTFSTTHQSVNVYSQPEKKYEIRCEETAIDIQLK